MRSPKDMRTIQIDITNACVHSCSNCTRFCGHHRKPFFMDWETFKRAVDSLDGFDKRIGIMGGEPTLHPQFERFAKYAACKHPSRYSLPSAKKPIKKENFIEYIRDRNFYLDETLNDRKGLGLWSSLGRGYYQYYELIQDVFSYQCINDHQNNSMHQPLLVSRKELKIPDNEWVEIRDNCWIQNMWSATITPKGAFFCEVAGAMDMLFDGPGGWPIEPGWWKREPKDFGYQLQWCEICGAALFNKGRISKEEIDDVSPLLYERLKEIGSPKVKAGKVNILDVENPEVNGGIMPGTRNRYISNYLDRALEGSNILAPEKINAVIFCYFETDVRLLYEKINTLGKDFDSVVVAIMDENMDESMDESINALLLEEHRNEQRDGQREENMEEYRVKHGSIRLARPVPGEWGRTFNKVMSCFKHDDWICILDIASEIPVDLFDRIKKVILNPGCIYYFNTADLAGKLFLFNKKAYALKHKGFDGISICKNLHEFIRLWDKTKQIELNNDFDTVENPDLEEWFNFAGTVKEKSKERIYKCLGKIKNDIEEKKKQAREEVAECSIQ